MSDASLRLEQVYQARSPEQLQQAYGEWAASYDLDLVEHLGWDKPERVAEVVARHSQPSARVLDIGAGTGLVGAFLAGRGYTDLTALDYTAEMLAQARARGVYGELLLHDLNRPLPLPDGSFDLVVGVGIFTEGHVGPGCLAELARVTRGPIIFSLRDDLFVEMGFEAELKRLNWSLLERVHYAEGLEGRPWSSWVYSGSSPSGPP